MDPAGYFVRIVAARIVPNDEAIQWVVEAPSETVVRDVPAPGGVPFDRISVVLTEPDHERQEYPDAHSTVRRRLGVGGTHRGRAGFRGDTRGDLDRRQRRSLG
jgi:hypothetical protein